MFKVCIGLYLLMALVTDAAKKPASYIDPEYYNGFIERDFPFVHSALDLGRSPVGFEQENYTPRGILLQLNSGVWACFDKDLLRVSAIWRGGDFELNTMAQISYPGTGKKSKSFPRIKGELLFSTGVYPGVSFQKDMKDPRVIPLGEISDGRWQGLQLSEDRVVLKYKLANQEIRERISEPTEGVISRQFYLPSLKENLQFTLFQKRAFSKLTQVNGVYEIHGEGLKTYVAATAGYVELHQNGRLVFFPQEPNCVVSFSQDLKSLSRVKPSSFQLEKLVPAKKRWPQSVETTVKLGSSGTAYTYDEVELPFKNVWKRSMRLASIDFFKDGRAAAVSFDGDVWLIEGLDNGEKVVWRRFASGLYSPLSIKVHKEKVYVFGRGQVTRLHDQNNDGEADFYENYSSAFLQAMNTRDFAMDMSINSQGDLFLAKGGIQNMGGTLANKDFYNSPHAGAIIRVYNDGKSAEVYADGFREPFLGFNSDKEILYATDQQGHYIPATPILQVSKGAYFGHEPSNYRKLKTISEPATWIPHRVDNSASGMTYIKSSELGPLNKHMVLHSYGKMASFIVYEGQGFGGVAAIPGMTHFPQLKGAVNPVDGQLYVTGFKLYNHYSRDLAGLSRLRYTGKPTTFPDSMRVFREGVELQFDASLKKAEAESLEKYEVKRWNYKRTAQYGSGHFRLNQSSGEEQIQIAKAVVSADRKKVFLVIPGMSTVNQMSIDYSFKAKIGDVYFTVGKVPMLPKDHFTQGKLADVDLASVVYVKNVKKQARAELGKNLVVKHSCVACHSLNGENDGKVGPSFKGLMGAKRIMSNGTAIVADESYIKESLFEPNKKIAKGYQVAMGSYKGILSEEDIASIIMYFKTLK